MNPWKRFVARRHRKAHERYLAERALGSRLLKVKTHKTQFAKLRSGRSRAMWGAGVLRSS
jgi:hypothetical protein